MASLLSTPGTTALVAEWAPDTVTEAGPAAFAPAGLALFRVMGREAEILSLGVVTKARRLGIGRALLSMVVEIAKHQHADEIFLEVAENNTPAITLYSRAGFRAVGQRKNYYAAQDEAVDALVLAHKV